MKIERCPRCGAPGYLIIDERELKSGTQVYYFVVHKYRDSVTGKLRTRKCSIGSEGYIYVTKTHTLPVYGVSLRLSNVVEAGRLAELAVRAFPQHVLLGYVSSVAYGFVASKIDLGGTRARFCRRSRR